MIGRPVIKYTSMDGWLRTFEIHEEFRSIPHGTREALALYLLHGCRPGSFTTAFLAFDIVQAYKFADKENAKAMNALMAWMNRYVPAEACGSYERVRRFKGYVRDEEA